MTPFKPGEVVLLRFPFTDLSSTKKRPAVVVSPAEFSGHYGDVVVLALTSVEQSDDEVMIKDWKAAGLLKPTWMKLILATLCL